MTRVPWPVTRDSSQVPRMSQAGRSGESIVRVESKTGETSHYDPALSLKSNCRLSRSPNLQRPLRSISFTGHGPRLACHALSAFSAGATSCAHLRSSASGTTRISLSARIPETNWSRVFPRRGLAFGDGQKFRVADALADRARGVGQEFRLSRIAAERHGMHEAARAVAAVGKIDAHRDRPGR